MKLILIIIGVLMVQWLLYCIAWERGWSKGWDEATDAHKEVSDGD